MRPKRGTRRCHRAPSCRCSRPGRLPGYVRCEPRRRGSVALAERRGPRVDRTSSDWEQAVRDAPPPGHVGRRRPSTKLQRARPRIEAVVWRARVQLTCTAVYRFLHLHGRSPARPASTGNRGLRRYDARALLTSADVAEIDPPPQLRPTFTGVTRDRHEALRTKLSFRLLRGGRRLR
jgi:hypothetical protein